jgi:hypothetical protein
MDAEWILGSKYYGGSVIDSVPMAKEQLPETITCPYCQKKIEAALTFSGSLYCSGCGGEVRVELPLGAETEGKVTAEGIVAELRKLCPHARITRALGPDGKWVTYFDMGEPN